MNDTERKLAKELRQKFAPGELNEFLIGDHTLIQWIKAKDNNVGKAEEMLRKCLKWREENDITNILSWTLPSELKSLMPYYFIGYNCDNLPVILSQLGSINLSKIIELKLEAAYVKNITCVLETALETSKEKLMRDGTPVRTVVFITDAAGVSVVSFMNKKVLNLMLEGVRVTDSIYSPYISKIYIINAGKVFSTIFPLIRACMSAKTGANTSVYNTPSSWKPVLLKTVPADVLAAIPEKSE